jgi:hypothetical protein
VADETPKRTTSFAKTIKGLEQEENSLDKIHPLNAAFLRALQPPEQKTEQQTEKETTRPAPEMTRTHSPRPELHLRPEGPTRRAMDRKIDYEKLRQINDAAKRRAAAAKSRSLSRDFERER